MPNFVIQRTTQQAAILPEHSEAPARERWYWAGRRWSRDFNDAIIVHSYPRAHSIICGAAKGRVYTVLEL